MSRSRLSRRRTLKGLGVGLGLPLLEQMAWADEPVRAWDPDGPGRSPGSKRSPVRMAFLYTPVGVYMPDWKPKSSGGDLPFILKPLQPVIDKTLVLGGLSHPTAMSRGPGGHERETGTFLTGAKIKEDGSGGISVDQYAAQRVGHETPLPSLETGVDRSRVTAEGNYLPSHSSNISWRTPTTPMAKDIDPRSIFQRLFMDAGASKNDQQKALEISMRRSVLDLVRADAGSLAKDLGPADKRKLEEYLESLRDVEKRIDKIMIPGELDDEVTSKAAAKQFPKLNLPKKRPKDFDTHVKIICDLIAIAFQSDRTRIATFMFGNGGSGRSHPHLGVSGGLHQSSHHEGDQKKINTYRTINRYYVQLYTYLLEKLDSIKDGRGTLLDNSMIMFGSGMSDGNRHTYNDLPILLAGRGAGSINSGRHVRGCRGNLNDLYIAMLARMGVRTPSFGDDGRKMLPDLG